MKQLLDNEKHSASENIKKITLFDLDHTLFDSASFRQSLFKLLAKNIGKEELIEESQRLYETLLANDGVFNPDKFLSILLEKVEATHKKAELMDIIFDDNHLKEFIHTDVLTSLTKIAQISEIGLFSQGEEKMQRAKIKSIQHFFAKEKIHISINKKSEIKKIFGLYNDYQVFFVDDVLPVLAAVHVHNPAIVTVWIKRGKYAQLQQPLEDFTAHATILSLTELVPIIEKGTN